MIESVRRCDNPTCRVVIPETAKRYELNAALTRINGDERQEVTNRELCGHACLMASLSELIKTVDAEPVSVAECHAIGTLKKMVTAEPLQDEFHSSPTG